MRAWLQHHGLCLAQTIARLARSPFATTLNVMAIGVAAALPFGVYCVLSNFESLSRNASVDPQLSVFLARDAAKPEVAAVDERCVSCRGTQRSSSSTASRGCRR
jgi:cell division protein FtsX